MRKLIKKIEYFVISRANATIICTEDRKEQIKNSKPKKLYIVHNSPVEQCQFDGKSEFCVKIDRDKDTLAIGYVGSLSESRFIKEVLNIVKSNPKFILNIAGLGPLEHLVKEATENYQNIRFFGRIKYEDALDLYAQCDIMFAIYDPNVPNHRYSAPNKVYEAMMLGKPIIVAKGTGIDKLIENEKIGFAINYSEKEFKDILEYILENKHVLLQIQKRSKKVFKKYSWSNMKKRIHEIYDNISK
jgi:glycosyltransferase involved in cell wall biosynthesis